MVRQAHHERALIPAMHAPFALRVSKGELFEIRRNRSIQAMMNITETERLILRRFTLDDVADMTLFMGDPEVMKYSVSGVMSFEQTQQFIERIIATYQRRGFG